MRQAGRQAGRSEGRDRLSAVVNGVFWSQKICNWKNDYRLLTEAEQLLGNGNAWVGTIMFE